MNPRQYLLQGRKELLPPALGALVGLLLIRLEARLLHAHVGPRARRGESPSDDTLETKGRPRVRQRFIQLDCQDLTVNNAPVCAKIETVVHDRLEVVLHQPLLDQVSLSESAPDLFRRMRYLTFDNDGERFGRLFVHWSILFSRSSRWSNRFCQNPAICLVQSMRGQARRAARYNRSGVLHGGRVPARPASKRGDVLTRRAARRQLCFAGMGTFLNCA